MPSTDCREITVEVRCGDAGDGILRLVADVSRFGLTLRTLSMDARSDVAVVRLGLMISSGLELENLVDRFSRHLNVQGPARVWESPEAPACAPLPHEDAP